LTLDDVKAMTDDFITPATAASVMKMDVGRLIGYARSGQLPFPVVVSGNRVKIPRAGFLRFLGAEAEERKRTDGIEEQLKELIGLVKVLTGAVIGILTVTAPEIAGRLMDKEEALQ
jgi:hypothetical protein